MDTVALLVPHMPQCQLYTQCRYCFWDYSLHVSTVTVIMVIESNIWFYVTYGLTMLARKMKVYQPLAFSSLSNACLVYVVGEIAQSLTSLSTKRAVRVRARLDPLVLERWNSFTYSFPPVPTTGSKRWSMRYYVCVIMHVKDP